KGIRSSPRDALVAEVTPQDRRGDAYGYHRAMDNLGAVVGPLVGFVLLSRLHLGLRTIFAWAALPAGPAMAALIFGVREPATGVGEGSGRGLVAALAGPGRRGRAFGWFHAVTGLLALPASIGFGQLYARFGALTAFSAAASVAAAAALLLAVVVRPRG